MKIIILAGGGGTRLWPLSRDCFPKQFIKFQNNKYSLLQETFERSLLLADFKDIFIVTNKDYKFLTIKAIEELGHAYPKENILIEPEAKNTLPAIYFGVNEIIRRENNKHDTILVFPSDHIIAEEKIFAKIIKLSEYLANYSLVTFGIKPSAPHTGYGYIAPIKNKDNISYEVKEFKEKPDYQTAVSYIEKGYYWNSGIFMFNSKILIDEMKKFVPDIVKVFEESKDVKEAFDKIKTKISIDYGIMEKSKRVTLVPMDVGWNDLGSFDSFYDIPGKEKASKDRIFIDCNNNILHSENDKLIVNIGVDNLIVIDSDDVLLVCKKGQSQKVKKVVEHLKKKEDVRTKYHTQDFRPWGSYKVLSEEKHVFKVKKIKVDPGKKLSYQLHYFRDESWTVVCGLAKVIIDDKPRVVGPGENVCIEAGQKHRLENIGKVLPLEIIEVQTGKYLGEDDIVRFDDDYGRK